MIENTHPPEDSVTAKHIYVTNVTWQKLAWSIAG